MECDTFGDAIVPLLDIIEALDADDSTNDDTGTDDIEALDADDSTNDDTGTDDPIVLGVTTVLDTIDATDSVSFIPLFVK